MRIQILGAESFGVRGLCCFVTTDDRKILIDPGVSLGYRRHGLLPHPFQVAVGKVVKRNIISAVKKSTGLIISHFHGDHVPLADANPYQLSLDSVSKELKNLQIWSPQRNGLDGKQQARRDAIESKLTDQIMDPAETGTDPFAFSPPMPHGEYDNGLGDVIMSRVEDDDKAFVHASDIQLLETKPIRQIVDWKPDIALVGGPPLYLPQLSNQDQEEAWNNAVELSRNVPTLILDHHLLRSRGGVRWLKELNESTENEVVCSADFMERSRVFLEAWRETLYEEMPVPDGWHKAYERNQIDTEGFRAWRGWDIREEFTD